MASDPTPRRLIRRRVLIGTASNSIGRLVSLGVWFLLTPFLLDRLGVRGYGLWALVGSIVAYGTLLDLGIGSAIVKYVAEYRARDDWRTAHMLVGTAIRLYALLGILAMALGALLALAVPSLFGISETDRTSASLVTLFMGVNVGLTLAFTPASAVLRGLQRYDLYNVVTTAGGLVTAAATVVVLLNGGGLVAMVALNIPIAIAMQLASIGLVRRVAPELHFGAADASRAMVGRLLSFGSAVFVAGISTQLQRKTDEIVIGAFVSIAAVTPYAVARRLSELAHVLADQFVKVLLPVASELEVADDPSRLRLLYLVSTRITLAIVTPITVVLVVLAEPILVAWGGPAFAGAAPLVRILALAGLAGTSLWPAGAILQGIGRYQVLAGVSLVTGIANLGLSIALVGPFGITGVAVGTLVPAVVESVAVILPYTTRVLGISTRELLGRAVLPALAPAVPVALGLAALDHVFGPLGLVGLGASAVAGLVVYLGGYLMFSATEQERGLLRDVAAMMARRLGRPRT